MFRNTITFRYTCAVISMVEGILLYYVYAEVVDPTALKTWLESVSKGLVGRVRIAREGVNGTLGGTMERLAEYVRILRREPLFAEVDFKCDEVTAERRDRVLNATLRRECGFDALTHRLVDEVVAFGESATRPKVKRLQGKDWDAAVTKPGAVVIDVRNAYESAIGRFIGSNVLTPQIRSTSAFKTWLQDVDCDGVDVCLYCTGGVRCENAAALVASKNPSSITVLDGGILRYLHQSELFHGDLFVFDPRISIPGPKPLPTTASCVRCRVAHVDDYCSQDNTRLRCSRCRVLVLVCDSCRRLEESNDLLCSTCCGSRHRDQHHSHQKKRSATIVVPDR